MIHQTTLEFRTRGRGTTDIVAEVQQAVAASGIAKGLCTVFLQHTSASLILCENADPDVRVDLEMLLSRLAPDGDEEYVHDAEGPDDMASHARPRHHRHHLRRAAHCRRERNLERRMHHLPAAHQRLAHPL